MDYLLEYAQREDVRRLAARFLNQSEVVQGIAVDLDDLWLAAWRLYNTLPRDEFDARMRRLASSMRFGGPYLAYELLDFHRDTFVSYPYGVDPAWMPPYWDEVTHLRGGSPTPFVIVVVLRPTSHESDLRELDYADTNGHRVRFEPRPMARLYAAPKDKVRPLAGGVSISASTGRPGTLGGILQANGARYALTCSHVLDGGDEAHQPSPADNGRAAERIGDCVESCALMSHVPPLDPYDPSINTVDAAVVQLDDSVPADMQILNVGALAGISTKSQVHPNSSVEIAGKEAGHQSLYIGGVTMVHEFDLDGAKYGYRNLFELKRASRFHGITGTLNVPVSPGDSGAWVLRAGPHGAEWLGVVVAGDGPYGYAIPAEFICDWIATTSVGIVGVA